MSQFTPKTAPAAIVKEAVIRVPRAAKVKAVAQPTPAEALHADAAPLPDEELSSMMNNIMSGLLPSKTRLMIATICGLLVYAGSLYWAMQAVGYLTLAVLMFTGSTFLTFVVAVIGWFFAIVGALRIGYRVAGFVLGFDATAITDSCEAVKTSVTSHAGRLTSWFKSSKELT